MNEKAFGIKNHSQLSTRKNKLEQMKNPMLEK